MESCREAARLVNSREIRDAKEILLPIFQQGTLGSLLWGEISQGGGEGGEEKGIWEVCGCKGCEKWGSRRVEVVG
jgi:hypothetical protein